MTKAIIFDLWETLATKNIGISKTLREHFDIPKTDDFMHRYERAIQLEEWQTEDAMAEHFLEAFNVPISPEATLFVVETLKSGIEKATLFDGVEPLLTELHRSVKLGLLSNTTVFESVVLKQLGISELFDATVFSWEIASIKPSERNFHEILTRLNVSAEESVFVDDGAKNVEAAKALGLSAIQFETVDQLRTDLKRFI